MMTTDPHQNEYFAAVAGMEETYGKRSLGRGAIHNGRLVTVFGVGDWVTARLAGQTTAFDFTPPPPGPR